MLGSTVAGSRLCRFLAASASLLATVPSVDAAGYNTDFKSTESVYTAAKTLADDMLSFYKGDQPGGTPGLLPDPYYWWEAGAMMGSLIDYWYYTGDNQHNKLITDALLFQVGDKNDYMPSNQTLTEGNDDQGFWGLTVMSAAEYNFPNPPSDKPQWLALAQAVFNTQAARWETADCNGGLRWQIFQWNNGYDYKNSISQACFFALGARLALYTGNQTYADWAVKTWDWMWDTSFIDHETYYIIDGADIGSNCTKFSPYQFSYNAGGFILGAAAMYNFTESKVWKDRLDGLVKGSQVFFTGDNKDIMTEVACEPVNRCNTDQQSFKAYLSRWLAVATQWAPDTYKTIYPYIQASAAAALKQCTGGSNGRMCGLKWNDNGKYDGSTGVGQQMAALEIVLATTIKSRKSPLTAANGGTSQGNAGAGSSDIGRTDPLPVLSPINTGDRAGAAILTIAILLGIFGAVLWLLFDETSDKNMSQQIKGSMANMKGANAERAGAAGIAGEAAASGHDSPAFHDKAARAGATSVSSRSSRISEKALPQPPLSRVHTGSSGDTRRASNMPIGWPRNSVPRAGPLGQAVSTDEPVTDHILPVAR